MTFLIQRLQRDSLTDILVPAFYALMCGAPGWVDVQSEDKKRFRVGHEPEYISRLCRLLILNRQKADKTTRPVHTKRLKAA